MENDSKDRNINDLPDKTLLSPREVASFFGVSLKTVYRWHKDGLIVGVRMKRSVRIFRDSVLKCTKEYFHLFF
jgi:excisionase family DNA binding protein